jgi:hypothetical protein
VLSHIESLPLKKRLALDAFPQDRIASQERWVDFPFVEKQVQELALGIREGQNCRQIVSTLDRPPLLKAIHVVHYALYVRRKKERAQKDPLS